MFKKLRKYRGCQASTVWTGDGGVREWSVVSHIHAHLHLVKDSTKEYVLLKNFILL